MSRVAVGVLGGVSGGVGVLFKGEGGRGSLVCVRRENQGGGALPV